MLVLSRNPNQSVVIADKNGKVIALVTVTEIERNKVKIGFSSSPEIAIHRKEIYLQIYGELIEPVCKKDDRPISVKSDGQVG